MYSFGKRLREDFDPELLRKALTERSYVLKLEEEQEKVGIETTSAEKFDNTELVEHGNEFIKNFIPLYMRHTLPYFPEEGIQYVAYYLP